MIKKKKRRVIYKADYANYAQVQILLLAAQRASRSARVKEIHSYTSPIVCGARIRCRFPPFSRTEVSSRTLPGSCLERLVLSAYTHHVWSACSSNTVGQLWRRISRPLSCLLRADKEANRKCNEIEYESRMHEQTCGVCQAANQSD